MRAARFSFALICVLVSVSYSVGISIAEEKNETAIEVTPAPSATAGEESEAAPAAVPEKISNAEVRKIRREFIEVLDREREALRRDQKRMRRESDAGRRARKADWLESETMARRQFFSENEHGPERRTYVRDFNERRKNFFATLKQEEQTQKSELDARWKSQKEDQRMRLNRVEEHLSRGERPPANLLQSGE